MVGFLDDNLGIGQDFIGFPILGSVDDYEKFKKDDIEYVIAIDNAVVREKIA